MVKEYRLTLITVVFLVVIGGLGMSLRCYFFKQSRLPPGQSIWRLTYSVDFQVREGEKCNIALPDNTPQNRIFRESFSRLGIWMDIIRNKRTGAREAVIVPLADHTQGQFRAQFDIHVKSNITSSGSPFLKDLSPAGRAHYLRTERHVQTNDPYILNILSRLTHKNISKSQLLENIFNYCAENVIRNDSLPSSDALNTLREGTGTSLGQVRAMLALCRTAKIPARLVTGFIIENQRDAKPQFWIEVLLKKKWFPCDPVNGYFGNLPAHFLPLRCENIELIKVSPQITCQSRFAIYRLIPSPLMFHAHQNKLSNIVDLTRLSPGMQEIVMLLLLIPIGALITTVFRNIIGLPSFGTFTPTLIALSFIKADWRTGCVLIVLVISVGILTRFILDKLKLLLVARLSIILTLVISCMILAVSILDHFSLTPSASAVLLPTVILTFVIERFFITWEEDSLLQTMKMAAGTLIIAVVCFGILGWDWLGRLILTFPELQLWNIALLLLLGRYTGYRLSELWRFRDLLNVTTGGKTS